MVQRQNLIRRILSVALERVGTATGSDEQYWSDKIMILYNKTRGKSNSSVDRIMVCLTGVLKVSGNFQTIRELRFIRQHQDVRCQFVYNFNR
jgi:hypothetical protein